MCAPSMLKRAGGSYDNYKGILGIITTDPIQAKFRDTAQMESRFFYNLGGASSPVFPIWTS